MKRFIAKTFTVYEAEAAKCLWLALIFFAVFWTTAIFRSYVDTAFLKRYGAGAIPEMLFINGVLTIVVFAGLNRLAARFADTTLLSAFLALCAAAVALLFGAVGAGKTLAYPALFQILNLQDSVFLVYLWNMACDLFDTRQGKRIFPLIMASQVLGTGLGSFAVVPLSRINGHDGLLPIAAAAYLLIAVGLGATAKGMMGPFAAQKTTAPDLSKTPAEILRILRQYPIVRYLIVAGLLPNILLPVFTYQFSVISQNSFASEQGLMAFLSVFRGSATVVSFALLLVMGRLTARMGVPLASMIQPLNFMALFFALIPFFNIYVAAYGQFSTLFIQRAVAGPVNKVLFNVLPESIAAWGRVFVRATVIKAAVIAGSLTILLLKPLVSAHGLAMVAAVIAAFLAVETWRFKRHYTRGLKQALMEEATDPRQMTTGLFLNADVTSMVVMSDSLTALGEDTRPPRLAAGPATVQNALEHLQDPDPAVRADAAAYFTAHPDPRAIHRLLSRLDDRDAVREAAIEALAGYGETARPFLEARLAHTPARLALGILKTMKSSGLTDFDLRPFVSRLATQAYRHLAAIAALGQWEKQHGAELLTAHLRETNEEILGMVFYALWIADPNMRLMYRSLRSEKAATAVEMVEASLDRDMARCLVPLIDEIPLTEKIQRGRKVLPLVHADGAERMLAELLEDRDPVTRMLTAYAIGQCLPQMRFYSAVEALLEDPDIGVREAAAYAMQRCLKEDADMPETIHDIRVLQGEALFEGIGMRGYRAIAAMAAQKFYKQGDILIRQGEAVGFLFLLRDGQVRVAGDGASAESVKTLGNGDTIGAEGLLSGVAADKTYVVESDFLEALVFTRQAFFEIMSLYPQISINLCRQLAIRLSRTAS